MAKSIFQISPVDAEIERQNARIADSDMSAPALDPIGALPPLPELPRPARSSTGSPGRVAPPSDAMMKLFVDASVRHQVPLNIVMALAEQESSYNPMAVGTRTEWGRAKGLMQYLDSTAAGMGINPFDPAQAIDAAARQLRQRLDKGYSMRDAVMEHHAGPDRKLWGPVTRRYGVEVLDRAARLKGELAPKYGNWYSAGAAPDNRPPPTLSPADIARVTGADARPAPVPSLAETIENPNSAKSIFTRYESEKQRRPGERGLIAPPEASPTLGGAISGAAKGAAEAFKQAGLGVRMQFEDVFGSSIDRWVDRNMPGAPGLSLERQREVYGATNTEREYARSQQRAADASPRFNNWWAEAAYGGLQSLIQTAPGIAAGVVGGAPLGLAVLGGQTEAQSYGKYRTRGATPGMALLGAVGEGAVEAGTEMLPMGWLTDKFGKVGFGQFLREYFAREMPTEQIATFLQDAIDTAIANPDKTWGDFWAERADAAGKTAVATLMQSGAFAGLNAAVGKIAREDAAQAKAELAADPAIDIGDIGAQSAGPPAADDMPGSAPAVAETPSDAAQPPIAAAPPVEAPSGPLSRALANAPILPPTVDVPMPVAADAPAQPVTLVTPAGEFPVQLVGETPDAVWLKTSSGEELQIPRAEIDAGSVQIVAPGTVKSDLTVEPTANAPSPVKEDLTGELLPTPDAGQQVEPVAPDAQKPEIVKAPVAAAEVGETERVDPETGEIITPAPEMVAPAARPKAAKPAAAPSSNDVAAMDEPALRARLKYLHEQARTNAGWTKPLLAERKKVEAAINQMIGLRPADPEAMVEPTPAQSPPAVTEPSAPAPDPTAVSEEAAPASQPAIVEEAAAQAATSPLNDRPEPTQAQKDAGNFKLGHVTIGGLDVSIEYPAGVARRAGYAPLAHAYGYIRGTIGHDKEHLDVFLGPYAADVENPVFVIDQLNADREFDESKVMLGFANAADATAGYLENYPAGWPGLGGIRKFTMEEFKAWAMSPEQTTRPASNNVAKPDKKRRATNGNGRRSNPRDVQGSNVQAVAEREGSLSESQESVLPQLRGTRDNDLPSVAGQLSQFPERGGTSANTESQPRSDKDRRPLRTGERPVADEARASEQYAEERVSDGGRPNENASSMGGDNGIRAQHTALSAIEGNDGRANREDAQPRRTTKGRLKQDTTSVPDNAEPIPEADSPQKDAEPKSDTGSAAPDPFAKNKLITADKVEAARARLREKMNRLNSGMDPEVLVDGMTIAAAYIEAGVRKFADYAKAMRADFGERITPYLLSFWEGARHYPGLDTAGMTSPEASRAEHAALLADGLPTDEATALGTEVAKPKVKKATKTPAESRKLRDDWGVEHINGYAPIDGGKNIETDAGLKDGLKDAFLQDGLSYLRAVASLLRPLGFVPHVDAKGKEENPVRRSVGGPAVSGDVSLHMRHPERGANIYVTLGGSSMRGAVPTTKSGVALMYRVSRKDGDKYATSGVNRWTPVDLSALDLADTIAWEVGRGTPELARDEAPAADHSVTTMSAAVEQADAPGAAVDSEAVIAEVAEPSEKIEDFGEKLEGARKDYAQRLKERMIAARDTDIAAVPLAQSWPEPDYQKLLDTGVDAYVVAAVHALRDAIPTKPQKPWRLKGWVENVRELRDYADGLLNNTEVGEAFRALSKEPGGARAMRDIDGRIDLYLAAGHDRSLKGISLQFHRYGLYNGQPDVELWMVESQAKASAMSNWPRELAKGETRQEAIDAFVKRLQEKADIDAAPRATRFDIYTRGGKSKRVFIGKKIGREYIDFRSFDDPKAARRFLDEHRDELEADLDRFLTIPEERRASNAPRVGVDHRSGADVTPEVFADTFGFRGVQFGNYVEGDRRQADLNESFDALLDMAGVLGIPPRAISLGGALGLAFGARGRGGANAASAHYEPGTVVINLTKRRGAGSLAHEWWHALDNYFSRMGGDSEGFLTNGVPSDEAVRPEIVAAFHEVVEAINRSAIVKRSRELDRRRSKPYWSTDVEMSARAFESYIIAKLADNSQANDYLANIVDESAFGLAEGYPYPTADEMPAVRAAFDNLFQVVEARPDGDNIGLFSTLSFDLPPSPTFTATEDLRQHLVDQPYGKAIGLLLDAGKIVIHADATTLPIERNSLADAVPKPDPASQEASSSSSAPIAAEGPAKPARRILTLRKESNNGAHAQAMTASDGVVHLVANALTSRTALPVLLHEMFHSNVRPLIGSAAWSALMRRMAVLYRSAALREAGFDRPNNAYWRRALDRVEAAAPPIGQEVEEFAAYAIEERALAPAGIGEIIDRMIGALKAWILRRFKVQAGSITPSQLHALAVAALRSGPNLVPARAQAAASTAPLDTYAAEIIAQLATVDDLFQNPVSTATTLSGVFADVDPTLQPVHVITSEASEKNGPFEGVLKEMRPAERVHVFRTARDRLFFVAEEGKDVWLDVSRLREGEAGSRIYAAVADYAFNTGRVFIGDPAGLSDIALRRRTEAMLASAIKHGTTRHLLPHERQTRGDSALGVPRLRWVEGDTLGNVQRMINVSLASLRNHVPEFERARYDFSTGTFRTGEGKPLTDRALDEWADTSPRARTSGAGSSTFKRGILLNTLARTEVAGRPGLLEQSLQIPDQLVGAQARGIFYSRVVPSVDEIDAATPGIVARATEAAAEQKSKAGGTLSDLAIAAVPLRPLLDEWAKSLGVHAGRDYLRIELAMRKERDRWHERADNTAKKWLEFKSYLNKERREQNRVLMDLMHEATLAGVDPSQSFVSHLTEKDHGILRAGGEADGYDDAVEKAAADSQRKKDHARLAESWRSMPKAAQDLFVEVRDTYRAMSAATEQALLDNLSMALDIRARQAKAEYDRELIRVADSSMDEDAKKAAFDAAERKYKMDSSIQRYAKGARMTRLRHFFETNNLSGPYFPLKRFGKYFVTVRDAGSGQVISFSRFESARAQRAFVAEMEKEGHKIEKADMGIMARRSGMRDKVDPRFVADIENILEGFDADQTMRDAIWQRWLETMPDMSIRTSRIHRKGTAGYSGDAIRVFAHHLFHGAHQLARLKYGLALGEALEEAERQARASNNRNTADAIVNEMHDRHDFIMNPTNSPWVQRASSLAFIYYLGFRPSAALVNLAQTVIMGVPILAAYDGHARSMGRASFELNRALKDFVAGGGHADRSSALTDDERAAMGEAYDIGLIDRSNSHDLAGLSEIGARSGLVQSARIKAMTVASWGFHHTERLNREVTFLAAYRMARKKGETHEQATETAARLTWKIHFDYSNAARPRLMQKDVAKVLLTFRNFTVNMLWRLAWDLRQWSKGETPAARKEAKIQFLATTAMMMATAGIRGTWFFGAIMAIAAGVTWLGGGDPDEPKEEFQKSVRSVLGERVGNMVLNGIPGEELGISLSERIGMPDLWFRSSDRMVEGEEAYYAFVDDLLGPVAAIIKNAVVSGYLYGKGHGDRALETTVPLAARDQLKALRYLHEGVRKMNGDSVLDEVSPIDAFKVAMGFTPEELAATYERATVWTNRQQRINDDRQLILSDYDLAVRNDDDTDAVMARVEAFNEEHPGWVITPRTLRQSLKSRARRREHLVDGVYVNPKLAEEIGANRPMEDAEGEE